MSGRETTARQRTCPTCRQRFTEPREERALPFCSARCKMADLGRWLLGEYAVPSDEPVDEESWAEAVRDGSAR